MLLRIRKRSNFWYLAGGDGRMGVFGICRYSITGHFSFLQSKQVLVLCSECLCILFLNNSPGVRGGLRLMIMSLESWMCALQGMSTTLLLSLCETKSAAVKKMLIYLLWEHWWNSNLYAYSLGRAHCQNQMQIFLIPREDRQKQSLVPNRETFYLSQCSIWSENDETKWLLAST